MRDQFSKEPINHKRSGASMNSEAMRSGKMAVFSPDASNRKNRTLGEESQPRERPGAPIVADRSADRSVPFRNSRNRLLSGNSVLQR